MQKSQGWMGRLAAYVETVRREPFAYGRNDCALFVAGCVEAMTGEDPAAEMRGRYTTLTGGLRKVRQAGYIDHIDWLRALFDEVTDRGRPAPHLAQVGDIAVVQTDDGPALGLVQGAAILMVAEGGIVAMPLMRDDVDPPRATAKAVFRV